MIEGVVEWVVEQEFPEGYVVAVAEVVVEVVECQL